MSQEKVIKINELLSTNLKYNIKSSVYSSGASITFSIETNGDETTVEFTNQFIVNNQIKNLKAKLLQLNLYQNITDRPGEHITVDYENISYQKA